MAFTTTSLLLASQGMGAAAGLGGAYAQSRAYRGEETMYGLNARVSYTAAEDAERRGETEASQHLQQTGQMVGSQRAAMAAQGIDVNTGTAAKIQEDTKAMGALDAQQIRNNAWREAMGYRVEGMNYRLAKRGARNASRATLLTGGMKFAQSVAHGAYTYKQDPYLFESQRG